MYKPIMIAGLIAVTTAIGSTTAHEIGGGSRGDREPDSYRERGRNTQSPLSGAYVIRQKSSERYVDAYERSRQDFEMVTRPAQYDDTQVWILTPVEDDVYVIRQASSGRYMDAYEKKGYDFQLVTREEQDDTTQLWILTCLHDNVYTIQQASSGRFLDAYEESEADFRLVTRPGQRNKTQKWVLEQY